jgi:hypothetical protein
MIKNKSIKFSEPASYLISVQGKLPETIVDNFEGIENFTVTETNKSIITLITIKIKDQAHLSGLMNTIYDWRFPILKVECEGEIPKDFLNY